MCTTLIISAMSISCVILGIFLVCVVRGICIYRTISYNQPNKKFPFRMATASWAGSLKIWPLIHLCKWDCGAFQIWRIHFICFADVPWSWDRQYLKPDVYGETWPRSVTLYGTKEWHVTQENRKQLCSVIHVLITLTMKRVMRFSSMLST